LATSASGNDCILVVGARFINLILLLLAAPRYPQVGLRHSVGNPTRPVGQRVSRGQLKMDQIRPTVPKVPARAADQIERFGGPTV
jgi:hypothetical protein